MNLLKLLPLAPLLYGTLTRPALAQSPAKEQAVRWLDVEVGKSRIVTESRDLAKIVISDPEVAEVKSLRPGQFQVRGLKVGTTDLWMFYSDDQDHPVTYQVTVTRDISDLIRRVDDIVTGTAPKVYPVGERLVVEGEVSDVETLERVADMAGLYDQEFANVMTVTGDHQVQLSVVFAEVSRTGMRELGFNAGLLGSAGFLSMVAPGGTSTLNAGPGKKPFNFNQNYATTNGYNSVQGNITQAVTSPWSVLGILDLDGLAIFGLLDALEQSNLTKILAQPTLVALSGQQAEFLAGGEVPLAISTQDQISLQFKDYGIKLVFVPTVLGGEVVDMRVYAEVSEVDESGSVTIGSNDIPAFVTRKASSHIRLRSGMTFAMAGLLSERTDFSRKAVPILGEIPIVGALFRTTSHEREERELMIFVTPRLVRPMAASEVPPPPGTTEDNNPNDFELFLMGLDHKAGSRSAEPTGPIGMER